MLIVYVLDILVCAIQMVRAFEYQTQESNLYVICAITCNGLKIGLLCLAFEWQLPTICLEFRCHSKIGRFDDPLDFYH